MDKPLDKRSDEPLNTTLDIILATTLLVADEQLDLRGTPCPLNFVRTKLKLERMDPGALLEVWLDPGEPIEQVPDSLKMDGYVIEAIKDYSEYFALQVRCRENL